MGRLEKLVSGVKRAYSVGKQILEVGRQAGTAIRYLESHSNPSSSIGKRLRMITSNPVYQRAEKAVNVSSRAVTGIENVIQRSAPSTDLDLGHERISPMESDRAVAERAVLDLRQLRRR